MKLLFFMSICSNNAAPEIASVRNLEEWKEN